MNQLKKSIDITTLTKDEKMFERALENDMYTSSHNVSETKLLFNEAIATYRTLQKSKRITLRLNNADLVKVKVRARAHGIPYQTLLNMLIHQFAEGKRRLEI